MPPTSEQLWAFLPYGYLLTILIETPILMLGLSARHSLRARLLAGVWLTACTYPVVVLVLPPLLWANFGKTIYLVVAETFAPVAECILFWLVWGTTEEWGKGSLWRDLSVVTLANLTSFGVGELIHAVAPTVWYELLGS